MFEITYLVFIRYRGPFGISIPIPRLRTAHLSHPKRPMEQFDVAEVFLTNDISEDWESTIPQYLRYPTPIPCYHEPA